MGKRRGAPLGNQKARRHGFYSQALTQAESESLQAAGESKSLDDEIALLRVKLATLLQKDANNLPIQLQALRTLAHLVAIRYRIGGQGEEDLYHSIVGVLKGVGGVLLPDQDTPGG